MSLRRAVCDCDNIAAAFARHARVRGLWAPGIPMSAITAQPVRAILRLTEDLREGRYRPQPPKMIPIAKADGSQRRIAVYMIRDRVAQRALLQAVQRKSDNAMSPLSFGYRPGRGVQAALSSLHAHLASGYEWVAESDIEHCFDSIPHRPLLDEVEQRLDDPAAPSLFARYLGWDRKQRLDGIGIAQGSSLAPWLCNVYLWRLDDRMQEAGIPLLRYADDFVLLARTRDKLREGLDLCAHTLERMRLRLHPLKTHIVERFVPFRFLGSLVAPPPQMGSMTPC